MLCRDMETSKVSIAREVISPLVDNESVDVVFDGKGLGRGNRLYVTVRSDRTFPDYQPDKNPVGKLGAPWTLATWPEVVALRLAGQITKIECRPDVETGE